VYEFYFFLIFLLKSKNKPYVWTAEAPFYLRDFHTRTLAGLPLVWYLFIWAGWKKVKPGQDSLECNRSEVIMVQISFISCLAVDLFSICGIVSGRLITSFVLSPFEHFTFLIVMGVFLQPTMLENIGFWLEFQEVVDKSSLRFISDR
jgi:hypothetical protein